MEIEYMQQLRDNPNIGKRYNIEGLKEEEILKLESKYNNGNTFPKSFREYLFLGGVKGGTGVVDNDFEYLREAIEGDMEYSGQKLERPYFVFDRYEAYYSISFLDEDAEDTICYIYDAIWNPRYGEPMLKKMPLETFSNLINEAIYRIKNDIPF